METQFRQFQVQLEKVEGALNKCKFLIPTVDQKQFQKAKVSRNINSYQYVTSHDVYIQAISHKLKFNELKTATQSVLDIVDDYHKPILNDRLNKMIEQFEAKSHALQHWLEDKESQLGNMARANIVLPVHASSIPCICITSYLSLFHMQIRKAKEIQRDVNSLQSDMEHIDTYQAQYKLLKENIAKHISTMEQKRRWSLCGGAVIIGIVAIILGVLLFKPNTQSQTGKLSRILVEVYLRLYLLLRNMLLAS
jgi:hypothetical protein